MSLVSPAFWDGITKFLGVAAALLLVLSTSFDFSYLYALGLAFEDVPTSLTDHVRSALVWAPKAAVYILIIAIYDLTMRRMEGGRTEEELVNSSPNPRFTRWFRKSPRYGFVALVALVVASDFFFTNSSRGLYIGALFAWGTLALWLVQHERLGQNFNQTTRPLFVMLPILGIWVGLLGYGQGRSALDQKAPFWAVNLKTDAATRTQQFLGLRRFSTVTVLIAADRKVLVVPNETIASATLLHSPADAPGRLCAWFGWGCNPTATAK